MKLGFIGTRQGMSHGQRQRLREFLESHRPTEFHHGDCVGADEEAHFLVEMHCLHYCKNIIHPPSIDAYRAFLSRDEERPAKPYLERNHQIVDETDWLVAAPREDREILHSGTWATIRYARGLGRPLTILFP